MFDEVLGSLYSTIVLYGFYFGDLIIERQEKLDTRGRSALLPRLNSRRSSARGDAQLCIEFLQLIWAIYISHC